MLKNRFLSTFVLAAAGLFVSTAMANPQGSESDHGKHKSADVSFEKVDANGDGYISQSEFQDSQLNIEHSDLDTDNDGRVNQTEFAAFEQMHTQGEGEAGTEYQADPAQEGFDESQRDYELDETRPLEEETERDY